MARTTASGAIRPARLKIAGLSKVDMQKALVAAQRSLGSRRTETLRRRINSALEAYVTVQLVDRARQATPPSKLLKLVRQVEAAADKRASERIQSFWMQPSFESAIRELTRTAKILSVPTAKLKTDPECLRRVATATGARLQLRIRNAKARAAPGRAREARHLGNDPMRVLFGTFNTLWAFYFRELPGVAFYLQRPRGPYLDFVSTVLRSFALRLGDDVDSAAPGLRAGLRLTPHAIHGHFRRTRFSAFRRTAEQLLKENRN